MLRENRGITPLFIYPDGCLISLREPHPGRILLRYQIDQILETLEREAML
jgi:hypothetical protein